MTYQESKYSNTFIYKIESLDLNYIYVGHTIDFVQRKNQHIREILNINNNLKIYKTIRDNGGLEKFKFRVIGVYECKDFHEALQKENEHYELLNANLNSVRPKKIEKIEYKNIIIRNKTKNILFDKIYIKTFIDNIIKNRLLTIIKYKKIKLNKISNEDNIKYLLFNEVYYIKNISNIDEYDTQYYKKINKYDNINYLFYINTLIQYNNIKLILDNDNNDIFTPITNKILNINETNNIGIMTKIIVIKTIIFFNIDIRYEYFINNRNFKKKIDELFNDYLFEEYKIYFNIIKKRKHKYDFNISNLTIYKTMRKVIKEILNNIGLILKCVNRHNTSDTSYLIIYFEKFTIDRPEDIFIKKELIKKGHGSNVYVDINKNRVYEYNSTYYSYKKYKLTEMCKKFTENIDNDYINKPLIISNTEHKSIIEKSINNLTIKTYKFMKLRDNNYLIDFNKIFEIKEIFDDNNDIINYNINDNEEFNDEEEETTAEEETYDEEETQDKELTESEEEIEIFDDIEYNIDEEEVLDEYEDEIII